jgi:hypothetical protein
MTLQAEDLDAQSTHEISMGGVKRSLCHMSPDELPLVPVELMGGRTTCCCKPVKLGRGGGMSADRQRA